MLAQCCVTVTTRRNANGPLGYIIAWVGAQCRMVSGVTVKPCAFSYLLAVTEIGIWSGNFVVAHGLTEVVSPRLLSFLRWAGVVLVVLPISGAALRRQYRRLR